MPHKDPTARAAYQRAYRAAHRDRANIANRRYKRTPAGRATESVARTRTTARRHRFVGVDGEGYTRHQPDCPLSTPDPPPDTRCANTLGHRDRPPCVHHYMCLIAHGSGVDQVLYTGSPLTATQCLGFLADLPTDPDVYYVGFFFDYDATMILRDWCQSTPATAHRLLGIKPVTQVDAIWDQFGGRRRYGQLEWWRGFGVDYVPKKHLTVCRSLDERDDSGRRRTTPRVTVHDVRAFYQMSFVKALNTFNVGTLEQRAFVAGMKADREDFDPARAGEIIRYSKTECALLADLVSGLRDAFVAAGMSPYPYEGPGPVAGRVLERHVTGKTRMDTIRAAIPPDVWDLALKAYYGGRFEVAAHGTIPLPVFEYDIKSAYPAAMLTLPCLEHGRWVRGRAGPVWVGQVSWDMGDTRAGVCGPLPFRRPDGSVYFPTAGTGWYWSAEVPTDPRYRVRVTDAWSYVTACTCRPFGFVQDLYDRRATMEAAEKGSGIAIKLVLNSLYGKLAQRVGKAPHYNPVWAGLITATTRAQVYQVYQAHPRRVIMFATDAVFTLDPVPQLTLGTGLGQWEHHPTEHRFPDFTVFQPGVYFDGDRALFKTRGVPARQFTAQAAAFRAAANDMTITVDLTLANHLGAKLCMTHDRARVARDEPRPWAPWIGQWVTGIRRMNASPHRKRAPNWATGDMSALEGVTWSHPIAQPRDTLTCPYQPTSEEIIFDDDDLFQDGLADGWD